MNAHIAPIETVYRGYRFRSRLEARWAVFFDAAGIDFYYEPEAYQTSLGGYLPDFYLPSFGGGIFVEVKYLGGFGVKEWDKCLELSGLTNKQVLLADGPPDDVFYRVVDRNAVNKTTSPPKDDAIIFSDICEIEPFEKGALNAFFYGMFGRNCHEPNSLCRVYTFHKPDKDRDFNFREWNEFTLAFQASRAYRF
jgi:hypothetical protein